MVKYSQILIPPSILPPSFLRKSIIRFSALDSTIAIIKESISETLKLNAGTSYKSVPSFPFINGGLKRFCTVLFPAIKKLLSFY
jgi:hypothetical protein